MATALRLEENGDHYLQTRTQANIALYAELAVPTLVGLQPLNVIIQRTATKVPIGWHQLIWDKVIEAEWDYPILRLNAIA